MPEKPAEPAALRLLRFLFVVAAICYPYAAFSSRHVVGIKN